MVRVPLHGCMIFIFLKLCCGLTEFGASSFRVYAASKVGFPEHTQAALSDVSGEMLWLLRLPGFLLAVTHRTESE